ncbi:hypothetical protein Rhom172_1911 [Rhodothermus marinus SG0.5JP17-172]|jgi:hypothetical protein|uniref:hypothetical protein n=1 Tax=Rhodothermus marinus TaxID=29549 RepID=UPI000223D704|nr:hypothetical protein [Rhodothermus marinus]AEN73824.1 hypothetical protein Rhom172_1911 [Rhodothermus marinus SG0.5JP17-172]MBO2492711.1 hypothetical protein [Rhodothermus marinus]
MVPRLLSYAHALEARVSVNWIINRRADLLWFIGGALAGYALFFMHAGLGWDMITIWFLWVVFLDSPHFFGTISRTYLDKQELQQRKKLLTWSLLWFAAGPFMILLSGGLYRLGIENYQLPWKAFLVFFGLWAYWHVVRQHYGFMRLYQRKNNDLSLIDYRIDSALLYGGLLLPFVAFVVRHPEARRGLGLSEAFPVYPPLPHGSRLEALFDPNYLRALAWEHWVVAVTAAAVGTLAVVFVARQLVRLRRGEPINLPKILFMLAVVPLHVYVCYAQAVLTAPLLAFGAFVTIFHDIQYHAIVWFHHRNRYHRPGVDQRQFGLAPKISRNLLTYFGCAIFFAAIFRLLGCTFDVHPGCAPFVITSEVPLFGELHTDALLKGFLIGFPLHHYFVDQFIWKPSRSKELRKDLKLEA